MNSYISSFAQIHLQSLRPTIPASFIERVYSILESTVLAIYAQLLLQIQHQPVIMPAMYKVYANDNALDGKYSLFKMLVTNNSSNTANNIEVQFQIPNYIEWKTVTKIKTILPGQSVVVNCYRYPVIIRE